MPITKSAKKALRQSERKRKRNLLKKKKIKEVLKKIRALALENKLEQAKKLLPQVYKLIDKGAKTNIIKENTAARKKSRITKLVSKKQPRSEKDPEPTPA